MHIHGFNAHPGLAPLLRDTQGLTQQQALARLYCSLREGLHNKTPLLWFWKQDVSVTKANTEEAHLDFGKLAER